MKGEASLRQTARRRRIFELRVVGLTIPQISEKLKEEGYRVGASEHTVYRDLHSGEAKEFVEELLRRHLANISMEEDRAVKLKYYDRLLDKMMPAKPGQMEITGMPPIVIKFDKGLEDKENDSGDPRTA